MDPSSPLPDRRLPVLPDGPVLHDGYARPVHYLRVSLTDRCNYRCTYCMPSEGVALAPRAEVLSFEEVEAVVAALTEVGVRRVRLTGGEPTVRKDLLRLVERLARLPLDDLSLSTNGERLEELARPLRDAGLHRLNVSLDTLDPRRFQQVTRRGDLRAVLAGLDAARAAGFAHTKLNTVAMRGFNDDEVAALCSYAWEHGFTPRFIELMPMSEGALFYPGTFLPAGELRQLLQAAFGPALDEAQAGGDAPLPGVGPARYLRHRFQGTHHRVGLISAVTEPFCDRCNRVRLSATGQLHSCLASDESVDLRQVLREAPAAERRAALQQRVREALHGKVRGHRFDPSGQSGCGGPRKHMVSIGG